MDPFKCTICLKLNYSFHAHFKLTVISSPFYASAKQMVRSVFTNKYRDTSFRIVTFSRFLFTTCTRNKPFSEKMK